MAIGRYLTCCFKFLLRCALALTRLWSTFGASTHACKASGHHFFGLEADREIFEVLLKPLCTASEVTDESDDDDLCSNKQW